MLDTLNDIERRGLAELADAESAEAVEAWRIAYLGSKGRLKQAAAGLKDVPKPDKPAVGKRLNEVKTALESPSRSARPAAAWAAKPKGDRRRPSTSPSPAS
jgi:phenylalanyl-tRNA synthetase alpha chain